MSLFKNNGFSLIEVMVVGGLLGGLAVVGAQIMSSSNKGLASSEAKLETLELKRVISTTLSDQSSCNLTLNGLTSGDNVSSIRNSAGATLFSVGGTYGNNTLSIMSMKILVDSTPPYGDGSRNYNLNIEFKKNKNLITGNKNVQVSIPIRAVTDASTNKITNCFADTMAIVNTAVSKACTSLGGTWDSTNSLCNLPSCPAGKLLQAISASGPVCKSIDCPAGTFLTGLDNSGSPKCSAPTYN